MGIKEKIRQQPGKFELLKRLDDIIEQARKDGDYEAAVDGTIWQLEHLFPDTFGDKKTDSC